MSANYFDQLPDAVRHLLESSIFGEYATVSAQGVPIDTPTYVFAGRDSACIDVATGLAYPAKAERARRNPKVGLLVEGFPGEPVISIAAIAAVRDADIQANANRYIAETIGYFDAYSNGNPWEVARGAIHYWSRIIVECKPQRILWWPNAEAMDQPPQRWEAPAGTVFPASDPAPAAKPSKAPAWPVHEWRARAEETLKMGVGGHLTLLDDDGFPLPIRARSVAIVDEGFDIDVPAAAPWPIRGQATLCFIGLSTFVGTVRPGPKGVRLTVERMLPVLPMMQDPKEVFTPSEQTRATLLGRLNEELARRGQSLPRISQEMPQPTPGSLRRAERMAIIVKQMAQQQAGLDA